MQIYIVYLRVSTDKQGITGLGMEAQREAVCLYVQNRGHILAEYVEVESGKRHTNRPQLMAALAECRKRRAVLVIAKLDRLARNVAFIANLMNSDVEFVAVGMPTANRLTIHILAAVAEHEREMISQRTKAALMAAKARGIRLGNPRYEYALQCARAALQIAAIPFEVLSLIANWRTDGASLRVIAAKLDGIPIPSPRGTRWYASSVSSALARMYESSKGRKQECVLSLKPEISELNVAASPTTPSVSTSSAGREAKTEGVRAMFDLAEANRMLDTFVGSGATGFDVTFIHIDGEKRGFRADQTARQLHTSLPQLIPGLQERQQNIIVRPRSDKVAFVQLDDLSSAQVEALIPLACLTLEAGPGNHQAWVAVQAIQDQQKPAGGAGVQFDLKELARRLRKGVGADLNASGATREAGTPNFKRQHGPAFPAVKIPHAVPGRTAILELLGSTGLVAPPEPVRVAAATPFRVSGRHWPDYERCLKGAPMNHGNTGPDISRADYFWAMMAAQRGFGAEVIAAKLMNLSKKALENGERYCRLTAENAATAAERGRQRSRA